MVVTLPDDMYVDLDHVLAVALATATEVTQVESSHGFVAWQALVGG